MDTQIPVWLQALLGILPIPAFLKIAIEAAYLLWLNIPWFHKTAALVHLRKATRAAKVMQAPAPVEAWTQLWNAKLKSMKR